MKIKRPPELLSIGDMIDRLGLYKFTEIHRKVRAVDDKGRYLPWDKFQYRVSKGEDAECAWTLTKEVRSKSWKTLFTVIRDRKQILERDETYKFNKVIKNTLDLDETVKLYVTDYLQQICSKIDRQTSSAAEKELLGDSVDNEYLMSELRNEESIKSSQLEGAVTTTRVAQEMLAVKREPRNESEKMIMGNFNMMKYVESHAGDKLTAAMIKEIHAIGVSGINDAEYNPGEFRNNNEVVVEDVSSGDILHQPPGYTILKQLIDDLCEWANYEHETDVQGNYLHPLLKACVLHFMIGYLHPFSDGNGRTARAIFYWYMLKCGYSAFRYISISHFLKKSMSSYGKSYLYTETDQLDVTYFVEFQCRKIAEAVDGYIGYIKNYRKHVSELESVLWRYNSKNNLNHRQRIILSAAASQPGRLFTLSEAEEKFGISNNTARKDFSELVSGGYLKTHKDGRESVYVAPKNVLQALAWKSSAPLFSASDW